MIQLLYLLTGEFTVFLFYHAFSLWTTGWWTSPTIGGSIVLGGLVLFDIPLLLSVALMKRNTKVFRYLKQLARRIGFKRIRFVALTATILLGSLWILTFIGQIPSLHVFTPYEEVILFLTLLVAQIWFVPFFWQHRQTMDSQDEPRQSGKIILCLGSIYLAMIILKVVFISPLVHSLVVYFDSYQYWLMAFRIYQGTFNIAELNHYPPLYPLMISVSFLFGLGKSLTTISIINAILSSTSIFPIYLLAKQFFDQKFSVIFAIVSAVFPFHLVYPSLLASENLAYPLFFWAAYFSFSNPENERNNLIWDFLAAIAIGLLWLTRYQTLVLIPVFLISWWLKPDSKNSGIYLLPHPKKVYRLFLVAGVILLVFSPWAVAGIKQGLSVKQIIGTQIYVQEIPVPRTFTSLVFWLGITLAYIGLLAAPVLAQIIQAGISISTIVKDKVHLRWIIFVGLISLMLFVTVANHAWRAEYNYPIPNRLLGRYMLTLSVFVWLTALILYKQGIRLSVRKRIITGIIAFMLAIISFQIFNNPSWIIHKSILYYFFVDGYLPSLIPQYFFIILICTIGLSIFWAAIRQITVGTYFLAGGIAVLLLASFPAYYREIGDHGLTGRHLDELIQFIQSKPKGENSTDPKTIWFNPIDEIPLEREFIVRGISITENIVKRLNGNPAAAYKCKTRLMIQQADGHRYGIIENIESCTYPEDQWLAHYSVNQRYYALVELPAN